MDQVYRLFDRRCRTETALEKPAKLRRRVRRFKTLGHTLKKGVVQFRVAASSAAWGWQSSKSGATIPKSFGFEDATPYETTNNVTRNLTYLNHALKSCLRPISKRL